MKKILCNKKYSGILWAIVVASVFIGISLLGKQFLTGTSWFIFSSILRLVFGLFNMLVFWYKNNNRANNWATNFKGYFTTDYNWFLRRT